MKYEDEFTGPALTGRWTRVAHLPTEPSVIGEYCAKCGKFWPGSRHLCPDPPKRVCSHPRRVEGDNFCCDCGRRL